MNQLQNYNEMVFEDIKHINEYGQEYWYARELAKVLEYKDFRNFELIIHKAMEACQNSGNIIPDHFGEVTEMVSIGSGAMDGQYNHASASVQNFESFHRRSKYFS